MTSFTLVINRWKQPNPNPNIKAITAKLHCGHLWSVIHVHSLLMQFEDNELVGWLVVAILTLKVLVATIDALGHFETG